MFTRHRPAHTDRYRLRRARTRVSEPHVFLASHKTMHSKRIPLARMYEYRRKLPHYQKACRTLFVTFCKNWRGEPFSPEAKDLILQHCLYDHGKRYRLHAAVVMPEHVHLLLTPLADNEGWVYGLPAILKLIKGASARSVNKLLNTSGPVWQEESFDHVLRSQESLQEKLEYIRQNPIRRGLVKNPENYRWLWVEQSLCGSETPFGKLRAGSARQ